MFCRTLGPELRNGLVVKLLSSVGDTTDDDEGGIGADSNKLQAPGKPTIPWKQWRKLLENYLLASENKAKSVARRKWLLLHYLGVEGQRIFYVLPEEQSSASTGKEQDTGTAQKTTGEQHEFNFALAKLEDYFIATTNVIVERQRFRQRAQLPGELSGARPATNHLKNLFPLRLPEAYSKFFNVQSQNKGTCNKCGNGTKTPTNWKMAAVEPGTVSAVPWGARYLFLPAAIASFEFDDTRNSLEPPQTATGLSRAESAGQASPVINEPPATLRRSARERRQLARFADYEM
ncbi:hypothetical protein HPB49_025984 [Dermacentor silvarum]|nr:hypothetical protein HPB49_025984 [Dermacentor silvarum]